VLSAARHLRLCLDRPQRIESAEADQRNLQFIAKVLQHVEKAPLFGVVTGKNVVDLVNHEHLQADATQEPQNLNLPARRCLLPTA
jgi:ribosomal 50S subunit-associated protein YjgA (DUF615 family)